MNSIKKNGHGRNKETNSGRDRERSNENIKSVWITKKKNVISDLAKFENIVYLHDYIIFEENWYKNFVEFGENWDVCMNVILNFDNSRFRDWILWAPKYVKYGNVTISSNIYSGYFLSIKL